MEDEVNVDLVGSAGLPAPRWYPDLLATVSEHVSNGRRRAVAAANNELVVTYWHIGREILDRQHSEGWGTKVIDRLSADLRKRFPGAKGFSNTCGRSRRPGRTWQLCNVRLHNCLGLTTSSC